MSDVDRLLASLQRAVEASPEDVPLRLHFAETLLKAAQPQQAIQQLATVLGSEPENADASLLMARALGSGEPASAPRKPSIDDASSNAGSADDDASESEPDSTESSVDSGFDWSKAEDELRDVLPPRFIEGEGESESDGSGAAATGARGNTTPNDSGAPSEAEQRRRAEQAESAERAQSDDTYEGLEPAYVDIEGEDDDLTGAFEIEQTDIRLDDVGGMAEVKKRLQAAFLAPMRNPKLRSLFGKSLRGGLLLYGPPGCGKTFLAKAVAGELGAQFLAVTMHDILDMWIGSSEKNMHELFRLAREHAPCVLFFDELDAIGQKRAHLRHSGVRGTINQLLTEMDGVASQNDGVFALAATNHPWDVDSALLRPGRFDRTVAVLPPDEPARRAIFEYHLRERPVERIELKELAKRTDGFSGADIAHVCETASERALLDSLTADEPRMINMGDLRAAMGEVQPSTGSWFSTARNVALYANQDGLYNDLVTYMKKHKLL